MAKTYVALAPLNAIGGQLVTVEVESDSMVRRDELKHHVRHSPDGFRWGYEGSGPAELARCILIDALGESPLVEDNYQDFKREVIATLDADDGWRISETQVRSWLAGQLRRDVTHA